MLYKSEIIIDNMYREIFSIVTFYIRKGEYYGRTEFG